MKTKFIRIKDISEVDTSKCSVYDLNKRFIDEQGNMYALRYNRMEKKVELFKIMRTATKNAAYFSQRIMDRKKAEKTAQDLYTDDPASISEMEETIDDFPHEPVDAPMEDKSSAHSSDNTTTDDNISVVPLADDATFEPDVLIDDLLSMLKTHKERIKGIKVNIQAVGIQDIAERSISSALDEIMRNIEIDGEHKIDKVISSYRELTEYPRSLTYYMGKLDSASRSFVEKMYSDARRLKFIYYYEMNSSFWELFKVLSRLLTRLSNFLSENEESIPENLSSVQKQNYSDALTTANNTIEEISKSLDDLKQLDKLIKNPDYFQN